MTDAPNVPDRAPITITLAPEVAGALMAVTSAYASVLSWERRLDYCIAELAQWQGLIGVMSTGQDMSIVYARAELAFSNVRLLVENSIKEGLSD